MGSNDSSIAQTLKEIGDFLYDQGKIKEALEKYEQALEIWQKSSSKNIEYVWIIAMNLDKIGDCFYALGDYDEAMKKYDEAYKTAKDSDFPDSQKFLKHWEEAKEKTKTYCTIV